MILFVNRNLLDLKYIITIGLSITKIYIVRHYISINNSNLSLCNVVLKIYFCFVSTTIYVTKNWFHLQHLIVHWIYKIERRCCYQNTSWISSIKIISLAIYIHIYMCTYVYLYIYIYMIPFWIKIIHNNNLWRNKLLCEIRHHTYAIL